MRSEGAKTMPQLDVADLISNNLDVLSIFFDSISDMIFLMTVEEGPRFRYLMMNPAAIRVSGLDKAAYGQLMEDVLHLEAAGRLREEYSTAVTSKQPVTFSHTNGGVHGETILTPILDANGVCTHVFAVTRDVTERHRLEKELQYLAYHDPLTGLPNRRMFQERLQTAMSQARNHGQLLALLFIDCDLFKSINDEFGHGFGDEFLKIFSLRLQNSVREADIIARLGGDEFVLFLPVLHAEEAAQIGQRVLDAMLQPWKIGAHEMRTTVSVGVALYPHDGGDAAELMRSADRALYRAKATGRNAFVLFDSRDYA
jgi:diguanylate cyclase